MKSGEFLEFINSLLDKPISRQQFSTIYKLMVDAGHATPSVERQAGEIDDDAVQDWAYYIRDRSKRIEKGLLPPNQKYSLIEFRKAMVLRKSFSQYRRNKTKPFGSNDPLDYYVEETSMKIRKMRKQ
jgi:hypothetical protein